MNENKPPRTKAKLIQVLLVSSVEGQGTPDDPSREVRSLFSMDGNYLGAVPDSIMEVKYERQKPTGHI